MLSLLFSLNLSIFLHTVYCYKAYIAPQQARRAPHQQFSIDIQLLEINASSYSLNCLILLLRGETP